MNRGTQTTQQAARAEGGAVHSPKGKLKNKLSWDKIGQVGFLAAIVVLVVAVLLSVVFAKNTTNEEQYVDKSKLQAVFLNGGQVYFGNVKDLNSQYLKMSNIYYLRVNQQVQPDQQQNQAANDISLVKLGCELHGPEDDMVINREQVIFWENLKDDGQVAKAVAEYVKQNPNGQKCDQQQQQSTNNNNNATTENNTSNNNNTTNTTNNNRR